MERFVEATARVETSPERLTEILAGDPAGILTGSSSPSQDSFPAEIAVKLGGGTSLAQDVTVTFGPLPTTEGVTRFALSWRAVDHDSRFPVFGGDLEIHPEGTGAVLRLAGYYRPPLGPVGAFGDGLVGHRLARRALQRFLEAAATRVEAATNPTIEPDGDQGTIDVEAGQDAAAVPVPEDEVHVETPGSELFLG